MANKKQSTMIMNYNFIILGYRDFIKSKFGSTTEADNHVEEFLRKYHIDPVESGFAEKTKEE